MESCREAISEWHGATVSFNLMVYPSTQALNDDLVF